MEVQVAMVLLSIGMAGLYSMSVVQTKQTRRLTDVLPPADVPALNRTSDPWMRKLGVYASVEASVTSTGVILPYSYFEQVVDNLDGAPGYSFYKDPADTFDWFAWDLSPAYLGNSHYHRSNGNIGSYARIHVQRVASRRVRSLDVLSALTSLGAAIPHQIHDGTTWRTTVNVNQKMMASDVSYNGRDWDRLAVVQVNSGTLRVRLTDGTGCENYILADAMLVRSARSFDLVSVAETVGGGATATLEAP